MKTKTVISEKEFKPVTIQHTFETQDEINAWVAFLSALSSPKMLEIAKTSDTHKIENEGLENFSSFDFFSELRKHATNEKYQISPFCKPLRRW